MPAAWNWPARSRIHFRAPSVMTGETASIISQSPSAPAVPRWSVSVSVTEFGALTAMPLYVHEGAFDWMRSVVLDPKLSSAHTPENSPLMIARMSETISCSVSPYPMAWLTVVPPIEKETTSPATGVPGKTTVEYGYVALMRRRLLFQKTPMYTSAWPLKPSFWSCQRSQAAGFL